MYEHTSAVTFPKAHLSVTQIMRLMRSSVKIMRLWVELRGYESCSQIMRVIGKLWDLAAITAYYYSYMHTCFAKYRAGNIIVRKLIRGSLWLTMHLGARVLGNFGNFALNVLAEKRGLLCRTSYYYDSERTVCLQDVLKLLCPVPLRASHVYPDTWNTQQLWETQSRQNSVLYRWRVLRSQ
jgi:hypothetical protein